jgi:GTPase
MFFIRYRLHRQIYNHKAVKAIEISIIKLLFEMEKEMKISEYIYNPEYIEVGSQLFFRDGTTKGVGEILEIC